MPGALVVGQLIDEDQLRPLCQRRLKIEFDQLRAAIGHFLASTSRPSTRAWVSAHVRLDVAHQHVDAFAGLLATRLEHRVGLADAGGGAEKDLQLAPSLFSLFGLNWREEGIGGWPAIVHDLRRSGVGIIVSLSSFHLIQFKVHGGHIHARFSP